MMALEPRYLFDVAALTTGIDHLTDPDSIDPGLLSIQDDTQADTDSILDLFDGYVPPNEGKNEIVFVDSSVRIADVLLEQISANAEVITLDSKQSGILQISDVLNGRENITTIHLITQASNDSIQLGNIQLSADTADDYYTEIQGWSKSLASTGSINLYDGSLAETDAGNSLIETLGSWTQADIWTLENDADSLADGDELIESAVAETSIIFIDSRVQDPEVLLAGISSQNEIIYLDTSSDGIDQIAAALNGRSGIGSIHILSHGDDGMLLLGSTVLNNDNIDRYTQQLSSIGNSLTTSGDILLYGCDVAAGDAGQAFVNRLSELTEADIAASVDTTGNSSNDGNWVLESRTGSIETGIAFSDEAVAIYEPSLITTSYTGIGNNASDWNDSFNWTAGVPANGDDVIMDGVFTVDFTGTVSLNSLTLINGAILTLNGAFAVSGSTSVDAGSVISINSGSVDIGGTMTVDGTLDIFAGSVVTGTGTVTLTNGAYAGFNGGTIGGSVVIDSQAGSTIDIAGAATQLTLGTFAIWGNQGTVNYISPNTADFILNGTFNNSDIFNIANTNIAGEISGSGVINNLVGGVINKTTAVQTFIRPQLENDGTFNIMAGDVRILGAGVTGDDGAYTAAVGAQLTFDGHTRVWNAASSISGAGIVEFNGGNNASFTMSGTYNVTGSTQTLFAALSIDTLLFNGTVTSLGTSYTQIGAGTGDTTTFANGVLQSSPATLSLTGAGHTLDLGNNAISVSSLTVNGNSTVLTGTAAITVLAGGTVDWTLNGTIAGSGVFTTEAGVTVTLAEANLYGTRVWEQLGGVTYGSVANQNLDIQSGATLNNRGLFDIQSDRTILGTGTINNYGVWQKTVATGSTQIRPGFNNQTGGLVDIQTGILFYWGGGTNAGVFIISPSTELQFANTAFDLGSTASLIGTGTVNFGGVVSFTDNWNVTKNTPVVVTVYNAPIAINTLSQPVTGSVVDNGDGTFTYTPFTNYLGNDPFTYTVLDTYANIATATVNVLVSGVNDIPIVVSNNGFILNESAEVALYGANLQIVDPNGDQLLSTINAVPLYGGLYFLSNSITAKPAVLNVGDMFPESWTDGTQGFIVYRHDGTSNYADSFQATASDGRGGSVQFTVNLTITPVNDNPLAINDAWYLERASVNTAGVEASGGTLGAEEARVSGSGRYVVFQSDATNLTAGGDTNGLTDVFLRDLQTGTTIRISEATGGIEATGGTEGSTNASISNDGRYIVFSSDATNLDTPASNGTTRHIYLHDTTTGVTQRISVNSLGALADSSSNRAAISGDGNFVVFHSWATNLDTTVTDTNTIRDVFLYNVVSGTIRRISVDSAGNQALPDAADTYQEGSLHAEINTNGRYVVYASDAINLVAGDTNGARDIFVFDTVLNTTTRVDVSSAGAQSDSYSNRPDISADGRFIVYHGISTNLAGSGNSYRDVFLMDRDVDQNGIFDEPGLFSTTRVNVNTNGVDAALGVEGSRWARISEDGRFIVYHSDSVNLEGNKTNGVTNYVYMYDRLTGITSTVSVSESGTTKWGGGKADLSANGQFVVFHSRATGLVAGDTNGLRDIFVYDRLGGPNMISTAQDTAIIIDVLANDSDVELNPLTITAVTQPANGAVVINGGSNLTYTPNTGFTGVQEFTYTIADGNGGFDRATVILIVNSIPNPALWDGNSDGDGNNLSWSDPLNWVGDILPGVGDNVVIDGASVTYTGNASINGFNLINGAILTINSGTLDIASNSTADATSTIIMNGGTFTANGNLTAAGDITQFGGTINGIGTITINGNFNWSAGNLKGTGTTDVNGAFNLSGNSIKSLLGGRTLNANAGGSWVGTGWFRIDQTGTTFNTNGGVFDIQSDAVISRSGVSGIWNNNATVQKTTATGRTNITVTFNNNGTVNGNSGILEFSGGGTHTGLFQGTASLDFGGGTHNLNSGASVTAADVDITGGTTNINTGATYNATNTDITGGTLSVSTGVTANTSTASQNRGTLGGAGVFVVANGFSWSAGNQNGTGTTDVNGALNISGPGLKSLLGGRTLNANAGGSWVGTGQFRIYQTGTTFNTNAGVFDIQSDAITWTWGGGTWNNNATVQKTTATGRTNITTAFNNNGTVNGNSGILEFSGGGISSGTFNVVASATLDFGGGIHILGPTRNITGTGRIEFTGGTVTFTENRNTISNVPETFIADAGPITIGIITQPTNGLVTINAGDITYDPQGFLGNESFTYQVLGTTGSAIATVNYTITQVANSLPTGNAVITGIATEDQTLTVDTTTIADADGLGAFSYQWLRNGVAITGATGTTYILGDVDVGALMSVRISYTDGQGTAESLTSVQTAAVVNVNDAPTGNVVITGIVTEDQTLTANTASIADADGLGTFSYQWLRNNVAISGATGITYTLGDADVGTLMSVQVSYTDGQGTAESLTSTQTSPVVNVNDIPVGLPTVLGTPSNGNALNANTGGISDADGLGTFSYQWLRNGVAITGATASAYTLVNADVGNQMSVRINYTDGQGTAESLTSTQTAPVTNVNKAPTGNAVITGIVTEDQTLTVDTTSIADADGLGVFSYQWLRNNVAITGATGTTYILGDADVGTLMSVQVNYTDGQGTAESLTSVQTAAVVNINDIPTGNVVITGVVTEDQTLTANTATIADADGLGTFSYQWLRNNIAITGATGMTYTLGDADVGALMSVRISYTDGQGTAESLTSAATTAVVNVNDVPVGVPGIIGVATEGNILSVYTAGISDADGLGVFSYQWLRNGTAIPGAITNAFALTSADIGSLMSVQVSYIDGQGTAESVISTSTVAVTRLNRPPTFISSASVSITENITSIINLAANDLDGDTVTFAISGGNDATLFTLTGNQLDFISPPDFEAPIDANGDNVYEVSIMADDGNGGIAVQNMLVTVTDVNEVPVVMVPPRNQAIISGNTLTYRLSPNTFVDLDANSTLTYTASLANGNPLPSWLAFNPQTLTVSGVPGNINAGSYLIQVTASDGTQSTSITFTLTVAQNTPPVLSTSSTLNVQVLAGGSSAITSGILSVTDNTTPPASIQYTVVNSATGSQILLNGISTTTFTQQNINQGQVVYQSAGFTTQSSPLVLSVSDGVNPSFNVTLGTSVSVPFVSLPPTQTQPALITTTTSGAGGSFGGTGSSPTTPSTTQYISNAIQGGGATGILSNVFSPTATTVGSGNAIYFAGDPTQVLAPPGAGITAPASGTPISTPPQPVPTDIAAQSGIDTTNTGIQSLFGPAAQTMIYDPTDVLNRTTLSGIIKQQGNEFELQRREILNMFRKISRDDSLSCGG